MLCSLAAKLWRAFWPIGLMARPAVDGRENAEVRENRARPLLESDRVSKRSKWIHKQSIGHQCHQSLPLEHGERLKGAVWMVMKEGC